MLDNTGGPCRQWRAPCAQVSETSVALPILTGYVRRGTEKKRGARTPPASAHTFFFLCTTCNLPMATELLPQGTSSCYWSAHKEGPRGVTTVTAAPRTIKETPPNVVSRVPRLSGNTRWPPARHQSYPYRGACVGPRGRLPVANRQQALPDYVTGNPAVTPRGLGGPQVPIPFF